MAGVIHDSLNEKYILSWHAAYLKACMAKHDELHHDAGPLLISLDEITFSLSMLPQQ